MLSYIFIPFWFKSLFTLQDTRYPATEMEHAAFMGVGSLAAHIKIFLVLSDLAAKTGRLKIPVMQSTCKMEGKYILPIGFVK